MTQQVFADYIGIGAATLSSIFNGRTRPTLNIVEAVKKKIPNISTDWLMFGSGEMYLPQNEPIDDASTPSEMGSDSRPQIQNPMLDFDAIPSPTPQNARPQALNSNGVNNTRLNLDAREVKTIDKPQRRITEIRVFYDDQTWETFIPQKKS